jgi:hypothetical protein
MKIEIQDEIKAVLETAGFDGNTSLLTMHLGEIESELENVLDLFTILRSHSHRGDTAATQESLAEMTIALEHLQHHLQDALPELQKQLEIEPS